jgi:glutamate dehydrogenase (NAD(P)+)
MAKNHF